MATAASRGLRAPSDGTGRRRHDRESKRGTGQSQGLILVAKSTNPPQSRDHQFFAERKKTDRIATCPLNFQKNSTSCVISRRKTSKPCGSSTRSVSPAALP